MACRLCLWLWRVASICGCGVLLLSVAVACRFCGCSVSPVCGCGICLWLWHLSVAVACCFCLWLCRVVSVCGCGVLLLSVAVACCFCLWLWLLSVAVASVCGCGVLLLSASVASVCGCGLSPLCAVAFRAVALLPSPAVRVICHLPDLPPKFSLAHRNNKKARSFGDQPQPITGVSAVACLDGEKAARPALEWCRSAEAMGGLWQVCRTTAVLTVLWLWSERARSSAASTTKVLFNGWFSRRGCLCDCAPRSF